jgi:hypothetical protein
MDSMESNETGLQRNPLWPSALGAVQAHFQRWHENARAPGARLWTALAGDLTALGLDNATRDTLLGWADSRASQARSEGLRVRLLHPMEREMLTADSYGYLLDIYRLGLLGILGFEQVLELCATLTRLPATREQVQMLTQRVLSESIEAQGFGTAH